MWCAKGAFVHANGAAGGEGEEEYVIFDGHQVLPLYLIEYSATPVKQPIVKPTTGVSRDLKPNPFEEEPPEPEPDRATINAANRPDPLLQKLGKAAAAGGDDKRAHEGVAKTPRVSQARRECSDSELLSALRKIRAIEEDGKPRVIGCKKIREIGACAFQPSDEDRCLESRSFVPACSDVRIWMGCV